MKKKLIPIALTMITCSLGLCGCTSAKDSGDGRIVTLESRSGRVKIDLFGARIQTLVSTEQSIARAVKEADLVVGAVLIPGGATPKLFKEKYLKDMKPGAVFVDVAIDQGGCGETSHVTTHADPIFIKEGIVHYCVGNMPGAVPRTSTIALTNATLRYGLKIASQGLEAACKASPAICKAVNTYDGKLTFQAVADALGYEYTALDTLL